MAITTNHHWHNFLDWNELTENEQEEYSENEDALPLARRIHYL